MKNLKRIMLTLLIVILCFAVSPAMETMAASKKATKTTSTSKGSSKKKSTKSKKKRKASTTVVKTKPPKIAKLKVNWGKPTKSVKTKNRTIKSYIEALKKKAKTTKTTKLSKNISTKTTTKVSKSLMKKTKTVVKKNANHNQKIHERVKAGKGYCSRTDQDNYLQIPFEK